MSLTLAALRRNDPSRPTPDGRGLEVALPVALVLLTRLIGWFWVATAPAANPHLKPPAAGETPILGGAEGTRLPGALSNWDGQWYARIVTEGYPAQLPVAPTGEVLDNAWAFYPLYPGLTKLLTFTGLDVAWAAPLLSVALACAAMVLWFDEVARRQGRFAATLTVAIMCSWPSSLVLGAGYTESLALLLLVLFLRALRREQPGLVVWWCLLLAFTRPVVLVPAAVLGVWWLARWWRRHDREFPRDERIRWAAVGLLVALSYCFWPAVAAVRLGRVDAYLQAQSAWTGTDGAGAWPSWLRSAFLEHEAGAVIVVVGSLALFGWWARAAREMPLGHRALAVLYPLYIFGTGLPVFNVIRYLGLTPLPGMPWSGRGRSVAPGAQLMAVVLVLALGAWLQRWWIHTAWVPDGSGLFP